jgi:hypothetical protein
MIARVFKRYARIPEKVREWAEGVAAAAYSTDRSEGRLETAVTAICAHRGPVPRHTDDHPGTDGMMIVGLVVKSEGHVLFTKSMCGVGVQLEAGDLYYIDPSDPHWTECPHSDSELIFSVNIMHLDRPAKRLAQDMAWTLIAESMPMPVSG